MCCEQESHIVLLAYVACWTRPHLRRARAKAHVPLQRGSCQLQVQPRLEHPAGLLPAPAMHGDMPDPMCSDVLRPPISAMLHACRPAEATEGGERPTSALPMNGHAPSDTATTLHGAAGSAGAFVDQAKQSAPDRVHAVQTDATGAAAYPAGTAVKSSAEAPGDASKPNDRIGKEHKRSKEREKGDRKVSREREGKRSREKDSKSSRSDRNSARSLATSSSAATAR